MSVKTIIIAKSGGGKSTIAIELIKKRVVDKLVKASRVIIFSTTVRSDPKQILLVEWLQKKCDKDPVLKKMKYNYSEQNTSKFVQFDFLEQLFDTNEQLKEGGLEYHPWYIFLDDQQGESEMMRTNAVMKRLMTRGRHYDLSVMFCLQTYRSSIDPVLKDQVSDVIIGRMNSSDATWDVIKQFSQGYDDDPQTATRELYKQYLEILKTNNGYGFLVVHTEKSNGQGRYEINTSGKYIDR